MFRDGGCSKNDFPLTEALKKQRRSQLFRFHVPSHLTEKPLSNYYQYDFTELTGLDNLFQPEDVIARSQEKTADRFKAHKTYYIVNGSSAGLIAALFALCRPGDNVLIGGNFHHSVASALVFCGASPYFIPVRTFLPEIPLNIDLKDVESLLSKNSFKALLITSPSYWGVVPDLKGLCSLAKEYGMPVLVDEAHGGHFIFDKGFPVSASQAGADIWVNSAHKTLGALTPGALLHCSESVTDFNRLESALRMIQTSSPSYAVMASLEMAGENRSGWSEALEVASYCRKKLKGLRCFALINNIFTGRDFSFDPLRITILISDLTLTGFELKKLLSSESGIETEMAGYSFLTLLIHRGHKNHCIDALFEALYDIEKHYSNKSNEKQDFSFTPSYMLHKKMKITPREASDLPWQTIAVKDAHGRIAASTVSAFPPGIPALMPGQLIDESYVTAIKRDIGRGYFFTGIKREGDLIINVVKE